MAVGLVGVPPASASDPLIAQQWGATDTLDSTQFREAPIVKVSDDGSVAASILTVQTGSHPVVEVRVAHTTNDTATWIPHTLWDPGTDDGNTAHSSIALSNDGKTAIAAWNQGNASNSVWYSIGTTLDATPTWSTPTQFDPAGGGLVAHDAGVAISADGTQAVLVTATGILGGADQPVAAAATINTTTGVPTWESAAHPLGSSGQVPGQPAVSLSADGSLATAAYTDNNTGALWSASANVDTGPTSTWGSVVQVNGTTSPEATFSRLSLVSSLAGTTTAVAWCNVPDDSCQNEHVRAATVNAVSHAQSWGSETDLGPTYGDGQIALSQDSCTLIAGWYDGSTVFARLGAVSGSTISFSAADALYASGGLNYQPTVGIAANGHSAVINYPHDAGGGVYDVASQAASISGASGAWTSRATFGTTAGDRPNINLGYAPVGTRGTTVWGADSQSYGAAGMFAHAPTQPLNPSAVLTTPNPPNVDMAWTVPTDVGGVPYSYRVQQSVNNGAWEDTAQQPAGEGTAVSISGLTTGSYRYRVQAYNFGFGGAFSDIVGPIVIAGSDKLPQHQPHGAIPTKLRNPGTTMLNQADALTAEGLPVAASVKATLTRGDITCFRTMPGAHRKLRIAVSGKCRLSVRVTYTAPGNDSYYPYRKVVTYRVKKTR